MRALTGTITKNRILLAALAVMLCLFLSSCESPLLQALRDRTLAAAMPLVPTGLSVTARDGEASISWTSVSNATSYNIYVSTQADMTTANASKFSAVINPWLQGNLVNGVTYYFMISAVNETGESATTALASATPQIARPGVPANPGVTSGSGQNALTWSSVNGAASYNVYWSTSQDLTPATGTKVTGVTSPFLHSGLSNGTPYWYLVTAMNAGGESDPSSKVGAIPQIEAPEAPVNLAATSGDASATLTWTPVTGASSYDLYWSRTSPVTPATGTRISGISSASYSHAGLDNGATYHYIVTAINAGGESSASAQVSAFPEIPATGAPTGLSGQAGNGQVRLVWDELPGAASYTLYWSTTAGTKTNGIAIYGLANPDHTLTGLNNGTSYYFVVTAVNSAGIESPCSTQIGVTPLSPPGPPGLDSAAASRGQVALEWTAPVTGTAERYTLYWSTASTLSKTAYTGKVGNLTGTTYSHHVPEGGLTYWYLLTATNTGGESGISGKLSALLPPDTPRNFTALPGSSKISLSWTASTGSTGYNIHGSTTSGFEPGPGNLLATSTGTSWDHTGVADNVYWYYAVEAVNGAGSSAFSTQTTGLSRVTLDLQPPVASINAASPAVTLTWTGLGNATSYEVWRSASAGNRGTSLGITTSPGFTDSLVFSWTTWYYTVVGKNSVGEIAFSPQKSAMPVQGPLLLCLSLMDNHLSSYVVNPTTLASTQNQYGLVMGNPSCLAVDASGRFQYQSNNSTTYGGISIFPYDPASGRIPDFIGNYPGHNATAYDSTITGTSTTMVCKITKPDGTVDYIDPTCSIPTEGLVIAAPNGPSGAQFLYFTVNNSNQIGACSINPVNGHLSALSPPVYGLGSTTGKPRWISLNPASTFLYVSNYDDNAIHAFRIDAASGALTLINSYTVVVDKPLKSAVSPEGKYLAVCNTGTGIATGRNSAMILIYSIDQVTGALSFMEDVAGGNPGGPGDLAWAPSGKFLFFTGLDANLPTGKFLATYVFDESRNPFPIVPSSHLDLPLASSSLAIDPSGTIMACAMTGTEASPGQSVWLYTINADGTLKTPGVEYPTGTWNSPAGINTPLGRMPTHLVFKSAP